ncbi:LytR family transcriptional regulator, partial [Blastococcus sp. MG754426]|nr:LytR family transcriptional regulator [Blastococcus sp. MG754426]
MGDQPARDGAGDRDLPGRTRGGRTPRGGAAEPVTVEQLLARQGNDVGGRRAARRSQADPRGGGDRVRPAERGRPARGGTADEPAV